MVRRFNEDIPAIRQRKKLAVTQLADKILNHVIIGPRDETKLDLRRIQVLLQLTQIRSDLRARVIVKTRENMGSARHAVDALRHIGARHSYRRRKISGTVVQAWQNVTMQIDHKPNGRRIGRLPTGELPEALR